MARINILAEEITLDDPFLIEGLPGVGLVGKIVADHLIETFEMDHYANVHCGGLPDVVTYNDIDTQLATPVRLYADPDRDLIVIQSDVPVAPKAATEFAECLSEWFTDRDVTPVYLTGRPVNEKATPPNLYGVSAGAGNRHLERVGIDVPSEMGIITGPTGALLAHAVEHGTTAVGLIVQSDPQFPDPEAARSVITNGIEPLTDVEIPTEELVEHADEIQQAKEQLAMKMQDVESESTEARPLRMYQ